MGKIFFIPFSIGGGFLAAFVGKKLFDFAWGAVDDEEPPEPEHREVEWWKLITALALQGAIFRVVRGVTERGSRNAYYRLTGSWPGEEEPEPA
jgi:hypothetical protein